MGKIKRKAKERGGALFRRREPIREPYDVVLIVCEGAKTEPNYLDGLRKELKLSSLNIKILGKECGSDPGSVVECALTIYKESHKSDPGKVSVFCVFDRDEHSSFQQALSKVNNTKMKKGHSLKAITSIPCFEFWLLLHFEKTHRSFSRSGNRSPCDTLIAQLKNHIPDYAKGLEDIFAKTKANLITAIANAKYVEDYHKTSRSTDPSVTKVHHLVEYLQNLKKPSKPPRKTK